MVIVNGLKRIDKNLRIDDKYYKVTTVIVIDSSCLSKKKKLTHHNISSQKRKKSLPRSSSSYKSARRPQGRLEDQVGEVEDVQTSPKFPSDEIKVLC